MRKIEIQLTEQQEKFLKEFASKHYSGSDDNLSTHNPLHLVQTRRERVVDSSYTDPDAVKYILRDYDLDCESPEELVEAYYEDEECPIEIVSFEEALSNGLVGVDGEYHPIFNDEDYLRAYGIENYETISVEYYYDTVAYFFILDEAKRYMKYQAHNLSHPRTYTVSAGYSNYGDFDHFWKLLFSIGELLNKEEADIDKECAL